MQPDTNQKDNNTTMISPSTDEDDLFDVPLPDLPDDSATKEDALFGKAPILSPTETTNSPPSTPPVNPVNSEEKTDDAVLPPSDPLRDKARDPLDDPSQLFAFVTRTQSPKKQNPLLFDDKDDDGLFGKSTTNSSNTVDNNPPKVKPERPKVLNLFADDEEDDSGDGDLFSTNLVKKPLKETKIGLFDEDLDNEKQKSVKAPEKIEKIEKTEKPPTTTPGFKDIFDASSDEDDIFAGKKIIPKMSQSGKKKSLFDDDDDDEGGKDDDLFGKKVKSSTVAQQAAKTATASSLKRDLKKTAEKINDDPLSLLQDD